MTDGTAISTLERSRNMSDEEVDRIDACWRAANYLSVGQIYLLDNPIGMGASGWRPRQVAVEAEGSRNRLGP